jgi:hypothetical protein
VGAAVAAALDGTQLSFPPELPDGQPDFPSQRQSRCKALVLDRPSFKTTSLWSDSTSDHHLYIGGHKISRITGIEFTPGTRTTVVTAGAVVINGSNADNRRIDSTTANSRILKDSPWR